MVKNRFYFLCATPIVLFRVVFYGFICGLFPDSKVLKFDMHSTAGAEERGKIIL